MPALEGGLVPPQGLGFSIPSQRVELEPDFTTCSVKGKTWITISPHSKELKTIRLNCRQQVLKRVTVESKQGMVHYKDPYARLTLHPSTTVHQHELLRSKVESALKDTPEEELVISLPRSVHVREIDPFSAAASQDLPLARGTNDGKKHASEVAGPDTPIPKTADEHGAYFAPIKVYIEYEIKDCRDGLHFAGMKEDDSRYPHLYTQNSPFPGSACCLFPCIDSPTARSVFEIQVRCPRTLGDAFRKPSNELLNGVPGHGLSHDISSAESEDHVMTKTDDGAEYAVRLTEEEKSLDLSVVCSGNMTDEIVDSKDPSKKTVSFLCATPVAPHHIGFAIGPFEHVDLSAFRESDEDEMLGQNAIRVHGFCLPGRSEEVQNTCMPLAKAIDYFTVNYGSYPFSNYKLCFVDDLVPDVADAASLSICSNRLLFPPEIIDPIDSVTRTLVHALATQWIGVDIIPREPVDTWVVVGGSYFMTDMFLLHLCGKNEYRFRQKMAVEKVFDQDVQRPSLHQLGPILSLDPAEMEFMSLKAPLVLFILHQRLVKASGKNGVNRILWRMLLNSKSDQLQNNAISSSEFLRVSEKVAHTRLDAFFNQWIYGAGCPHFHITQRFNKKKLTVEMLIRQVQSERQTEHMLKPQDFMREVKEETNNVYAGGIQPLFTGPMTIRIHEADGTPYEHIVDIKEVNTKVEIPYNTKYKRLKRSRRQKERAAAAAGLDVSGDTQDDVLLYCLGDVLQSQEEVTEWQLTDWSKEEDDRMSQESYEWIRMDADFEWICKMMLGQPHYMFVSQLQQDKDVVAQVESIQYLTSQKAHPLISSILTRTLMDPRYFYGIRTAAAAALTKCARDELEWIGLYHLEKAFQELFCFSGSLMTRSNDFSDRATYLIQCAIPKAIATVRDNSGRAPMRVRRFFVDKLKFNDNSSNEFSDCYYVATLLKCLAESLTSVTVRSRQTFDFDDDNDNESEIEEDHEEQEFLQAAINEIDRYRRIDEWIPTYQNIYTVTSLECSRTLMARDVIPRKMTDFMQYARMSNSVEVRLKALACLVDLGSLRHPDIMRFFLYNFEADLSPYVRSCVYRLFGEGLGRIAIGTGRTDKPKQSSNNGLIIEHDASTENRQEELARMRTVPGALQALRKELGEVEMLKLALRDALVSPTLGLRQFGDLLDLCNILYQPIQSMMVTLKYPRYWKAEHLGEGKVKFSQTSRVRTTPMPKVALPAPVPMGPPAKPPSAKLRGRSFSSAFGDADREPASGPPSRTPSVGAPDQKGRKLLTLKMPNKKAKLGALSESSAPSISSHSPSAPAPSPTLTFKPPRRPSVASSPTPAAQPSTNGTAPPAVNGGNAPTSASPLTSGQSKKLKLNLKLGSKPSAPQQ